MKTFEYGLLGAMIAATAWLAACGPDPDAEDIDDPELHGASYCLDCDGAGPTGGGGEVAASSSSSGGSSAPDLEAQQTLGTYCARNAWGQLVVKIKNQGTQSAGASTTRVSFGSAGAANVATPALAPGATTNLYVNMPMACFGGTGYGNCTFSVTADYLGNVVESNEGNNATGSQTCPGG